MVLNNAYSNLSFKLLLELFWFFGKGGIGRVCLSAVFSNSFLHFCGLRVSSTLTPTSLAP